MMNKFFTKKILMLALVLIPTMMPSAYSQSPSTAYLLSTALRSSVPVIQTSKQAERKPPANAEQFLRTELFFGTGRENNVPVSDEEWQQFLDEEVTPRFPAGLTVVTAVGQFRGANGIIIQEKSMIMILLYPLNAYRSSSEKIEQIRVAYKQAFQQESVLRIDLPQPVWVSF